MLLLEKIYLVLYELSRLLLWFTLVNILWIFVSLPVAIVFIQIMLTTELTNLYLLLPVFSFLLPIFFFPGTHALVSSARDFILEENRYTPLSFFRYYKEGFKNSFLIGMVFTSLATVLGYLFYLSYEDSRLLLVVIAVLFFYLSLTVFYLLYIDAHYAMPLNWKVKQSLIFIMKHPAFAFTNFVILAALHYMLYSVSLIFFVLVGTTLIVYATYYLFIRKLDKIKTATTSIE